MKQCEGACEKHVGEVITVRVVGENGYNWGIFDYCEEAIADDIRNGFIVSPYQPLNQTQNNERR